jgi:hypothetical protein
MIDVSLERIRDCVAVLPEVTHIDPHQQEVKDDTCQEDDKIYSEKWTYWDHLLLVLQVRLKPPAADCGECSAFRQCFAATVRKFAIFRFAR